MGVAEVHFDTCESPASMTKAQQGKIRCLEAWLERCVSGASTSEEFDEGNTHVGAAVPLHLHMAAVRS